MALAPGPLSAVAAMRAAVARADPDEMAGAITSDIAAEVWPDRSRDPEFRRVLGLSVRDNARALVAAMAGTAEIADANPAGAFALAELTAQLGVPVSELESAYWVGARGIWREWFVRARAAGCGVGDEELDHISAVTMMIFEYVSQVLGPVIARYDTTRAEMVRNREDLRRAALAQILDGSLTQDTAEIEQLLGYPVRRTHVALVLEVDDRPKAERVTAALAKAMGAHSSLVLMYAPGTWMSWLGFCRSLEPREADQLADAARAAGVRMGIGEQASGLAGLRRTSEQALQVAQLRERVAAGLPGVVRHAEVRLELLLMHDEEAGRAFVRDELADLASYDERSDRTCEALLLWLAGGSQLDAAARLGVHKNTMRMRIAHAEEILGHRLSQRRPEIAVALRLREMLRLAVIEVQPARSIL